MIQSFVQQAFSSHQKLAFALAQHFKKRFGISVQKIEEWAFVFRLTLRGRKPLFVPKAETLVQAVNAQVRRIDEKAYKANLLVRADVFGEDFTMPVSDAVPQIKASLLGLCGEAFVPSILKTIADLHQSETDTPMDAVLGELFLVALIVA